MFNMDKILVTLFLFLTFSINSCFAASEPQERFNIPLEKEEMSLSEYAILYYGENNNEEALSYLLKIKEQDRTAQDWLLLGNILQDSGKIADAVFMYNRAIVTDKKFYKAYYNLANLYFDENKLNLAIENYKLATKYNREFPYAYYNLGCVYLEIGQANKAKIAFLKAIELKNTIPEFHYNLAYTYKKLGKEKLAKQYLENYNKLILGY